MGADGEGVVRFRIVNAGEAQAEPNIEIIPEPGAVAVFEGKPPSGQYVKERVVAGDWPASEAKKNKSASQFTSYINSVQRGLFEPPCGQKGKWSPEGQRRLLEWLLAEPVNPVPLDLPPPGGYEQPRA